LCFLELKEFSEVDGTVKFIEMFNTGFNILNSRSIRCIGNKKALCAANYQDIFDFIEVISNYIKGLKVKDKGKFVPILDSNRKTGFFGFYCLSTVSFTFIFKFN